jgi:hypothetical protein
MWNLSRNRFRLVYYHQTIVLVQGRSLEFGSFEALALERHIQVRGISHKFLVKLFPYSFSIYLLS